MRGLLAKAGHVRARLGGDDETLGDVVFDETGVSPEKRKELLARIEGLVARQRTLVPQSAFRVRAPKAGVLLPAMANLILAVLAAAVILVAARYFRVRQQRLSDGAASFLSTEGRLVDAIRRESEEKLRQKDTEITGIRGELDRLDQETEALRQGIDQQIRAREEELRTRMESLLEAERGRLRAAGAGGEEVEREIERLAAQTVREQSGELERYRAALAQEAAAREEEIRLARDQALESLKKADLERVILAETQTGAEEAKAGFDAERQSLQDQISVAGRRIRDLEDAQRREQGVMDQILASYEQVIEEITAGRPENASAGLLRLRRYLTDPALEALPAVAKRRQVDMFLIAALQAIVAPEYFDGIQSRELLESIGANVRAAEERSRAGDREGARRLYTEALGLIASVQTALGALERLEVQERGVLLRDSVARSARALAVDNLDAAAADYRAMVQVLPEEYRAPFDEVVANLDRAYAARASIAQARDRSVATEAQTQADLASREAIDALRRRVDELEGFRGSTEELASRFREQAAMARAILDQDRPDSAQAGVAMAEAFQGEAGSRLFPGLAELLTQISRSLDSVARDEGYGAGYRDAMGDVVDFTTYVASEPGASTAEESARMRALVETDPSFRSAVGGIQGLVGREDVASRFPLGAGARLAGAVSSVSGDRIVVESLTRPVPKVGARIEVRRSTAGGKEETIARGTVLSVDGQRIVVTLDPSTDANGSRVRTSDVVYTGS